MTELYAFWKYDLPPFALGGVVEKINEDNSVKVKNYGTFDANAILKIVPLEKGIKLQKKLDKAHAKYKKSCDSAMEQLKDSLKIIQG